MVMNNRNKLLIILFIGLTLRLILLTYFWDKPLKIVDETHYQTIAEHILYNHEFSLETGNPTSMRPPLYPAFLSTIYFLTGGIHLNAARIAQIILSLATIYMVFLLGKKIFNEKIGLLAAFVFSVYPSFLFFTHFLLAEVLFTFLFTFFIWYFLSFIEKRSSRDILLAGIFMGLSSLTRSILYPFLIVALIFLLISCKGTMAQRVKWLFLLAMGYTIIVGPWTIRNTLLYKTPVVVNTMGGFNIYMGNYEHTPLNRAWAAVGLTGNKAWYYGHENELSGLNEAQKEKWCSKKAKEFISDHKILTIKRSLIKAINFWGMERSIVGGIMGGYYTGLNKRVYLAGITLLIFLAYAIVVISSMFGFIYNISLKRVDILFVIILICFFTTMHSIVFGHSRYHLPLIPLLAIFSSWGIMNFKYIFQNRSSWTFRFSILASVFFIFIWVREIIFVEGARYLNNI